MPPLPCDWAYAFLSVIASVACRHMRGCLWWTPSRTRCLRRKPLGTAQSVAGTLSQARKRNRHPGESGKAPAPFGDVRYMIYLLAYTSYVCAMDRTRWHVSASCARLGAWLLATDFALGGARYASCHVRYVVYLLVYTSSLIQVTCVPWTELAGASVRAALGSVHGFSRRTSLSVVLGMPHTTEVIPVRKILRL